MFNSRYEFICNVNKKYMILSSASMNQAARCIFDLQKSGHLGIIYKRMPILSKNNFHLVKCALFRYLSAEHP